MSKGFPVRISIPNRHLVLEKMRREHPYCQLLVHNGDTAFLEGTTEYLSKQESDALVRHAKAEVWEDVAAISTEDFTCAQWVNGDFERLFQRKAAELRDEEGK